MLLTLDTTSLTMVAVTWLPMADRRALAQTCRELWAVYDRHCTAMCTLHALKIHVLEPYCTQSIVSAARCDAVRVVAYLTSIGCRPTAAAVYEAAWRGHVDVVRLVAAAVDA